MTLLDSNQHVCNECGGCANEKAIVNQIILNFLWPFADILYRFLWVTITSSFLYKRINKRGLKKICTDFPDFKSF
jgi:hypothetical protein